MKIKSVLFKTGIWFFLLIVLFSNDEGSIYVWRIAQVNF